MPPIIKIYRVPTNITGITDPTVGNNPVLGCPALESPENPDIRWFSSETMLPVIQGRDTINHGGDPDPVQFEPLHEYKVMLVPNSGVANESVFKVATGLDATGKSWVLSSNPDFAPAIYLHKPRNYFNEFGEVWTYTRVPLYSPKRELYYNLVNVGGSTTVQFTTAFMNDLAAGKIVMATDNMTPLYGTPAQFGVYASFWWWDTNWQYIYSKGSSDRIFLPPYGDYCELSEVTITKDGAALYNRNLKTQGAFVYDSGKFTWSTMPNTPGTIYQLRISGYRHTWERLWDTDLSDLGFLPGEDYYQNADGTYRISSNVEMVRAFTTQHPWYVYADFKVVNESRDTPLEKFCIYPTVRGNLDDQGNIQTGFDGCVNPNYPWDVQEGSAMETAGYNSIMQSGAGMSISPILVWEAGNGTVGYPNFCLPVANTNPADPLVPRREGFRYKFPYPCQNTPRTGIDQATIDAQYRGVEKVIYWFQSTRTDSTQQLSFIKSAENTKDYTGLWQQNIGSANRMILPAGAIGTTGPTGSLEPMPMPGTVMCRVAWTYRLLQSNGHFANSFRSDVNEAAGQKIWSLRVTGAY